MAAINPLAARLCVSPRASQQATPNVSSPAPQTRATVKAAAPSSGAPTRSIAAAEGQQTSVKPAPSSIIALTICRCFMDQETADVTLLYPNFRMRFDEACPVNAISPSESDPTRRPACRQFHVPYFVI